MQVWRHKEPKIKTLETGEGLPPASAVFSHVEGVGNPSALFSKVTSEVMKTTLLILPSPEVHLLIQPQTGVQVST